MQIFAEAIQDPVENLMEYSCVSIMTEGLFVDAMFMALDCRTMYHASIEALRGEVCSELPRVNFENCDTTLRALLQAGPCPGFIRELSAPGPNSQTLPCITLAYRVNSLLLARRVVPKHRGRGGVCGHGLPYS